MTRKLPSVAIFLFVFVVGFAVGSFWMSDSNELNQETPLSTHSAKEDLQTLLETEIADYYRLKSLEEKYKKSDEILGKIMTLLLVDLGLRASPELEAQLKESSQGNSPSLSEGGVSSSLGNSSLSTPPTPATAAESPSQWRTAEVQKSEIKDKEEIQNFLSKTEIPDFETAIKATMPFVNRTNQLHLISGRFIGTAGVLLRKEAKNWSVEMTLEAQIENENLKGKQSFKLADETGKVFSNSSGKGTLDNYKEFSSGSDALLVKASPTIYFQLYVLRHLDVLAGNVYHRESDELPYAKIGTVLLRRAD